MAVPSRGLVRGLLLSTCLSRPLASVARTTHHLLVRSPALASVAISSDLTLDSTQSLALISFGAVFLQRKGDMKARRLLQDEYLNVDDYLRVYPTPKRYSVDDIDWTSRVLSETSDYLIIDKPAMVPSNPTTDNAFQNIVECFKNALRLPTLYLPHRLDLETSGLMVLGKSKEFTADVSLQFKERRVSKRYSALLASNTPSSAPYKSSDVLLHYLEPSSTSPKVFKLSPPGLECKSSVAYVSPVVTKSASSWRELEMPHDNHRLRHALNSWLAASEPSAEVSFCNVQLDLHTGRTHQCRGQLSSGDWHIAGDSMYRGCTSLLEDDNKRGSEYLALQSSRLSFSYGGGQVTFDLNKRWWDPLFGIY